MKMFSGICSLSLLLSSSQVYAEMEGIDKWVLAVNKEVFDLRKRVEHLETAIDRLSLQPSRDGAAASSGPQSHKVVSAPTPAPLVSTKKKTEPIKRTYVRRCLLPYRHKH